MAIVNPIYLTDSPSHQQWKITVDNLARILTIPVSGVPFAPSSTPLNNPQNTQSYAVSIAGNPPPTGLNWGDIITTPVSFNSLNPTQLLVYAPNGILYAIIIDPVTGKLDVALASMGNLSCNTPISSLGVNVLSRLEEL